jgi:hypothetical protein
MAASLSSDGRIWAACMFCRTPIWRFPRGNVWRDQHNDTTCLDSPISVHRAELNPLMSIAYKLSKHRETSSE